MVATIAPTNQRTNARIEAWAEAAYEKEIDTVEATISSGMRGGMEKPRQPPADMLEDDADELAGRAAAESAMRARNGQAADPETGELIGLALTDPSLLHGKSAPAREWIVQDWIGCGYVTMLYGDGGTGKTLLMHQLMTSCAKHPRPPGQPLALANQRRRCG